MIRSSFYRDWVKVSLAVRWLLFSSCVVDGRDSCLMFVKRQGEERPMQLPESLFHIGEELGEEGEQVAP